MRRYAARLLFCCLATSASTVFAAPVAQKLVPAIAPKGARAIVAGTELDAGAVSVLFTAAGSQTAAAEIVTRTAGMLEVIVPFTAVTGRVTVSAAGVVVGSFDFTLAPEPAYVRVTTLAGGKDVFKEPLSAVVTLPDGRIFVADSKNNQIREISTASQVTLYAGSGKSGLKNGPKEAAEFKDPKGLAYDAERRILYVADSGNDAIRAIAADGTVTTLATQNLKRPAALALDAAGNILVADSGNHMIRKITPAGAMTTIAGTGDKDILNEPEGVLVTRAGAVIIADTKNNAIRRLDGGILSTLPSGELKNPRGLAEDDAGNLLVADAQNHRIRRIAGGVATTVAGTGKSGAVDGVPPAAEFNEPSGLAIAGAVYVSDSKNDAIRAIWQELRLTAIHPATGAAPGAAVRVFGTGFVAGRTSVAFGTEAPRPATFVSSTEVITAAPAAQGAAVDVTVTTPVDTAVLLGGYIGDVEPPVIHASLSGGRMSASGWYHQPVTIGFVCLDEGSGIASCTAPVTLSIDGPNQTVTGTAVDFAGLTASTTVTVSLDLTPPDLTVGAISRVTRQSSIVLSGSASDALSGLKNVTCNAQPATLTGGAFTCTAALTEGANVVRVAASDHAGGVQQRNVTVLRDATPPVLTILTPESGAQLNAGSVLVEAAAADDDGVASVSINGSSAVLTGDRFQATVALAEGVNTITAVATDHAGNSTPATQSVSFFSLPAVAIITPADLSVVSAAATTVSGTVSGTGVSVIVNGTQAVVSGGTFTASGIPLVQGRTVVTAKATNAAGHVATANTHLYRDSIPPRVAVHSPAEGQIVSQSPITVSGMVDDVAVGTINSGQASVTVNGVAATVSNRAFSAKNIALTPGANTLTIVATDQGGNQQSMMRHVTFDPGTGLAKIVVISGNDQSAAIGSLLAAPIVVRVLDAGNAPAAGAQITFKIVENDGLVGAGTSQGRTVVVASDAAGLASVPWTLGLRAGAGNQRVVATAPGFVGKAELTASGLTGTPEKIVVDAGNGQFGVVGQRLQRPLIACVVDKGSNRIANVPVRFAIAQGGGSINGQNAVTIRTDSDGRAWIVPTLGLENGADRNIFTAAIEGQTAYAAFYATGNPAGRLEDTRISGTIVDNTNIPVAGVSVRIEGTALTAQSNVQGRFSIQPAPVGYVKLIIDGSTAQRPGTWPTLEFAMYTNTGQDNTIGMPIYLLPIDVARGIQVNEQKGGTLTLPELPGFSLTVAPGSATFPNGARSGTVSVTLVHSDKMPMPPGFGQQPKFIVTIQPTGVHFDPPAAITFPNVDGLRPGEVTEMYSFDHDLGQFVSIGTGSVTEDGTTLRSDPGVGIIKGGWHCGGNPSPTGTPADCGDCARCVGSMCEEDPLRTGRQCRDDAQPCTDDRCTNGVCSHPSLQSKVSIEAKYVDRDDQRRGWGDVGNLTLGQPLYGSATVGDHVRWQAKVETTKPVVAYSWVARGPVDYTGPSGPNWQIDNINWKPGLYTVDLRVTFLGGCEITRSWGQNVGIRTDDYVFYGSILPEPESTQGVTAFTIDHFECPEAGNRMLVGSFGDNFNDPDSTAYVPEIEADRIYVNYRLVNTTANHVPVPNPAWEPRVEESGLIRVFGVSPVTGYRQAGRVQYKYLVRDGVITDGPYPVGDVFIITGLTPVPCATVSGFGTFGLLHPINGVVVMNADRSEFSYSMKIRAGDLAMAGYRSLNRRDLPWVFFRFRFDATDGQLKTRLSMGPSTDWDGPDNRDYSTAPTFFLYRRIYSGAYQMQLLPGFPFAQSLIEFLRASPRLPGGGPYYPSLP